MFDTLEATFSDSVAIYKAHRATLVSINKESRAMEETCEYIGISPYLIIPHAVLLHNEILTDLADKEIASFLTRKKVNLAMLEQAKRKAEKYLYLYYLPNVFNYITERTIYEKATIGRGAKDKLTATQKKLDELASYIDALWERRRDRGQLLIAILLALLSLLQAKDTYFSIIGNSLSVELKWLSMIILSVLVGAMIALFWGLKSPQKETS